jgi:glyoxylase-like metal-dependent hydrolase (beta-lactamase superfamily II)
MQTKPWLFVAGVVSMAVLACNKSEQQPAAAAPTGVATSAPAPEAKAPAATEPTPAAATTPTAVPAPADETGKLSLKVFTSSPEGFLVNATLISGAKDAILIDDQFQLSDAKHLAAEIKETKKNLTTVYVTHWHPDHYFGFVALKETFPSAKLVALPETVKEIEKTAQAKVKQWQPMFKDNIPAKPLVPEPLQGSSLTLEGQTLEIVGHVQGDDTNNSYVWIPSLKAVVCGDIVYSGVFPWTAETNAEQRKAWVGTIDKIAALNPTTVVPGHQKPDAGEGAASLGFMKSYLATYDEAITSSKTPADAQAKVKSKYPDLALDVILKIGTEAAYKKRAKK